MNRLFLFILLIISSASVFSQSPDTLYPVQAFTANGYKYGYINREGNLIIKPQYDYAKDFSEGLAFVKEDNRTNNWNCINTEGKTLFVINASFAFDFTGGQAKIISPGDSTFFVNRIGNAVEYSQVFSSDDKNIPVPFYAGNKWGFKVGVVTLIEPVYELAGDFSEGIAPVFIKFAEGDLPEKDCYNAFINTKGDVVLRTELKFNDNGYLVNGYFYSPEKWVNGVCRYYSSNDPKTRVEKYIRSDGRVIW